MRDPRLVSPFVLVLWKKGKSIRSSSIVDESRKFTMPGYFSHLPWTKSARERRYTRLRKDKVNRDGRNLSVICSRLIGINRARQYVQWMEERITRIVICRVIFFFSVPFFFFLFLSLRVFRIASSWILINRKNWQNLAKAANRALRIVLEDEEVQRSPWHEEVHTQAQNPGRILCDYGTPW